MENSDQVQQVLLAENQALQLVVEYLGGVPEKHGVQFWTELSEKLSRIVGKSPPWNWRYPAQVYLGQTQPSKLFAAAVNALGAAIDEVPMSIVYTVQVQVFAKPGTVDEGSVIMGLSKPCGNPACRVRIVPNVPWRKYCSDVCRTLAQT